jgi:hypothetical protein
VVHGNRNAKARLSESSSTTSILRNVLSPVIKVGVRRFPNSVGSSFRAGQFCHSSKIQKEKAGS